MDQIQASWEPVCATGMLPHGRDKHSAVVSEILGGGGGKVGWPFGLSGVPLGMPQECFGVGVPLGCPRDFAWGPWGILCGIS